MMTTSNDSTLINNYELLFHIDAVELDEYTVTIIGWAFLRGIHSWELEYKVDFKGKLFNFSFKPEIQTRNDVTRSQNNSRNYDESGFRIHFPVQNVGPDCYELYFTFKRKSTGEVLASFPLMGIKLN
jgi:hypothetical protein